MQDAQVTKSLIKYHKFISVVVIELSVRCLNTGPEDRLIGALLAAVHLTKCDIINGQTFSDSISQIYFCKFLTLSNQTSFYKSKSFECLYNRIW